MNAPLRRKLAVAALGLLVLAAGAEAARRHKALKAFRAGLGAYYAGDESGAEDAFRRSLAIRSDPSLADFLAGLLVERASDRLRSGDEAAAAAALSEAARLAPKDASLARASRRLMESGRLLPGPMALERMAEAADKRGAEERRRLPAEAPGGTPDAGTAALLRSVVEAQARLERGFFVALTVTALLAAGFLGALAWLLWALFGPRGVVTRLIEMRGGAAALPGSVPRLLGPSSVKEIEAIEAEFTAVSDAPLAADLLRPFLEDPDPAVRARAGLALLRQDLERGRAFLSALVGGGDRAARLAALSVLSGSPGPGVMDLLEMALGDPDKDIQAAGVRAIIHLKGHPGLAEDEKERVRAALERVRKRWIV